MPLLFDSNAARAEQAARLPWSVPDADPWMEGLTDGAMTFNVVASADVQQGFEHVDVTESSVATLLGLADVVDEVLAGTHARGLTVNDTPSVEAIRADLDGHADALADELAATTRSPIGHGVWQPRERPCRGTSDRRQRLGEAPGSVHSVNADPRVAVPCHRSDRRGIHPPKHQRVRLRNIPHGIQNN